MAYVPVPKDLSKIKTKLAFNLTKRQLVCFSGAAAVGLPAYLLSRDSIGNSAAMFLMIGLMLPFFFLAMYERDGLPLEKVLKNIIVAISLVKLSVFTATLSPAIILKTSSFRCSKFISDRKSVV